MNLMDVIERALLLTIVEPLRNEIFPEYKAHRATPGGY
jgi:hypothetical protein